MAGAAVQDFQGPAIEGDVALVQILRDAQRANIDALETGSLRARVIAKTSKTAPIRVAVSLVWSGDRAYWEFDERQEVPRKTDPSHLEPMIRRCRMTFDGSEFSLYLMSQGSPGRVVIFSDADFHNTVPSYMHVDQRPSRRWTKLGSGGRPWAELLGPHPNFKQPVRKWLIQQLSGGRVLVERHDDDEGAGISRITASLELAGNVIETSYKSASQSHESSHTWRKSSEGVVLLDRELHKSDFGGITSETELVVESVDLQPVIAPNQFEFGALKVRDGATVDDKIRRRRYTHAGRVVNQELLEGIARTLRESGFAAPPGR
jgi:hypothetical protein